MALGLLTISASGFHAQTYSPPLNDNTCAATTRLTTCLSSAALVLTRWACRRSMHTARATFCLPLSLSLSLSLCLSVSLSLCLSFSSSVSLSDIIYFYLFIDIYHIDIHLLCTPYLQDIPRAKALLKEVTFCALQACARCLCMRACVSRPPRSTTARPSLTWPW